MKGTSLLHGRRVSLKAGASSHEKEGLSAMHVLAQAQRVVEDLGLSNSLAEPVDKRTGSILSSLCDPEAGAEGWTWEMGKHGHMQRAEGWVTAVCPRDRRAHALGEEVPRACKVLAPEG